MSKKRTRNPVHERAAKNALGDMLTTHKNTGARGNAPVNRGARDAMYRERFRTHLGVEQAKEEGFQNALREAEATQTESKQMKPRVEEMMEEYARAVAKKRHSKKELDMLWNALFSRMEAVAQNVLKDEPRARNFAWGFEDAFAAVLREARKTK